MNPARSLNARRTKVAAPPVSRSSVVPSAYDMRDDEEEQPGEEQDVRREPERVPGDDPEREVDRARDLAVRDAEQVGRAEPPLKPRKLTSHAGEGTAARLPPR